MTPASSVVLRASQHPGDVSFLREVAIFFRQFIGAALSSYRPEQHYMRGPGPACRARQTSSG